MPPTDTDADTIADPSQRDDAVARAVAESVDADLEEGAEVGEYRVITKIGEGGFGRVYKAEHPLIGKSAAVKVLNREYASNAEMVSRFISEARAVNTIGHGNIIDIFSFGTLDDGRHYFVMELLDGLSFDAFIAQSGALDPALAIRILRGVARALDAAHAKDIVHRDLKPDNIFLSFDDEGIPVPKLLDFGIAKLLGKAGAISGHKTRTGAPVGTPHYMSPEQCLGLDVDHRSDIYSFGIVCFEALTGDVPFSGKSFLELMHQQAHAERPAASSRHPALGEAFDDAIRSMMALDPEERPASVGDALNLLLTAGREAGLDLTAIAPVPASKQRPAATKPASARSGADAISVADTLVGTPDTGLVDTPRPEPSSRSGVWIVAAAAILGVAGYAAMGRAPRAATPADTSASAAPSPAATSTTAPAAAPTARPSATTTARPAPSASAAPATVKLTVRSRAPGAVVYLDGKRMGPPGAFDVPPVASSAEIVVKAPGHRDATKRAALGGDLEVDLHPTRIVVRPPPKPVADPDLEAPEYK